MKTLKLSLLALSVVTFSGLTSQAQVVNYTSGNNNGYSVSNSDLLQTNLSSVSATGSFNNEMSGGNATPPYGVLTDGLIGTDHASRSGIGSGSELTYNLDLSQNTAGYNLTAINIYSSWGDAGRVDPNVTISYSLASAPTTFITLTTANSSAGGFPDPWIESNVVSGTSADLVDHVAALRFDFGPQENGFVGYSEIDVIGNGVAIPEPTTYALLLLGAGSLAIYLRRRGSRA